MNKNRRNLILFVILAIVWLVVKCNLDSTDYALEEDYETENVSDYNTTSYDWLYGTWRLSVDGETHIVSFAENGVYIESFQGYYGNTSESGSYTVLSGKVKLDSGDGYPSYIEIEGKRLKSDGRYYTKR